MPNTWKKKMVEQGYSYLDGPIHSMTEFFNTGIVNLEKSIPLSVLARNRNKSKKGSKKRKVVTFDDSEDEESTKEHKGKKFCQYNSTCGHTLDECTTLKALIKQSKQKKGKHFHKKSYTKDEVKIMVQKQVKKATKKPRKRRKRRKRSILGNQVHLKK